MNVQGAVAPVAGGKRIWIMCAIVVLLVLIVFSVRAGVSYVVQYRAHAAIDLWQQSPDKQPRLNAWQDMLSSVEKALVFDVKNADLQSALARLYFYRASNMNASTQQALQYYKQAMWHYRTVITLRPAWPYGYLNFLFGKIIVGELDAEMRQSLLHLIQLSPWEKNTLSDTVKVAVFVWPHLDKKSQQVVRPYLLLAADKRKDQVILALQEKSLKERFCKQIVMAKLSRLCP
ncbi:MAG: hypothetical protein COC22_00505 [Flavobacteriaceae bacterium]|nr:MAG: hypothetical protein COC22_00505 [Flavobacteriaceae bacterium]